MFEVYAEKGLTGRFRVRRGVMQCQAVITIQERGIELSRYNVWRDAKPVDFLLAENMAAA